jgi:hypothetical protein
VKYICLAAVLLALPFTADAQQRRSDHRRSDNRSEQRQSSERRGGDRAGDDRRGNVHRSETRQPPTAISPLPWWERQPLPWWERQQTPTFELNRIPGWEQGNVARALLDQQRTRRQLDQQIRRGQIAGGNRRRQRYPSSIVYVIPSYGGFPYVLPSAAPPGDPPSPTEVEQIESLPRLGGLRLEVEPRESLQVFLDSVYIGTPADLTDELELTPGLHRVELRAPGHRTIAFDVEIGSARLITYRGTLDRIEAAPATAKPQPQAAAGSKTMYVIPGCYLGNVSPKTVALPPGCDISKMSTIVPQ